MTNKIAVTHGKSRHKSPESKKSHFLIKIQIDPETIKGKQEKPEQITL